MSKFHYVRLEIVHPEFINVTCLDDKNNDLGFFFQDGTSNPAKYYASTSLIENDIIPGIKEYDTYSLGQLVELTDKHNKHEA